MSRITNPPTLVTNFDYKWRNWIYHFYQMVKGWGISGATGDSVSVTIAGIKVITIDNSTVSGDTRFMLYDVDKGALVRVSVGPNDSAGSGFKSLRVPNS